MEPRIRGYGGLLRAAHILSDFFNSRLCIGNIAQLGKGRHSFQHMRSHLFADVCYAHTQAEIRRVRSHKQPQTAARCHNSRGDRRVCLLLRRGAFVPRGAPRSGGGHIDRRVPVFHTVLPPRAHAFKGADRPQTGRKGARRVAAHAPSG